jgi:acyl carrier protein
MNAIQARLRTLLAANFGVEEEDLDPNATFAELQVDSVALVELAVVCEEDFGVKVADDELTPEHTIATVAELLASKGAPVT